MCNDLLIFGPWHVVTISAMWIAALMAVTAFVGFVAGVCLFSIVDDAVRNWNTDYLTKWNSWRKL